MRLSASALINLNITQLSFIQKYLAVFTALLHMFRLPSNYKFHVAIEISHHNTDTSLKISQRMQK